MVDLDYKDLEFMCGGKKIRLNLRLAQKQGLTLGDVALIKSLHKKKASLFKKMSKETKPEKIRQYDKQATELEFKLQDAWKFVKDAKFHPWYEVPHCACPKLDNQDYRGTNLRSYAGDCVVHSKED